MDNVAEVAKVMFGGVWKMILQTDFPGTDISLAAVFISVFIASFSIRIFGVLTGFGLNGSDYGRAANHLEKYRSMKDDV